MVFTHGIRSYECVLNVRVYKLKAIKIKKRESQAKRKVDD